jgi:hypothetical protein
MAKVFQLYMGKGDDGKSINKTVARIENNQFGFPQLSVNRAVLLELLKAEGEWFNLGIAEFADKHAAYVKPEQSAHNQAKADGYQPQPKADSPF